jgi:glycosidase
LAKRSDQLTGHLWDNGAVSIWRNRLVGALCAALLVACGGGGGGSNGGGGGGGGGNPPPVSNVDFRDEIVYQLLTDRFYDGDPGNDGGRLDRRGDAADPGNPVGWHGGDLAGVRQKLQSGYFQSMGFTAIWISPVVIQVPPPGNGGGVNAGKPFVGFHGYWADRFDEIEPHFGDAAALKALGEAADAAGVKLIIDVVVNHVGPGSTLISQHPTWFRTGSQCGSDDVTLCLGGLPDFKQEEPGVSDFLVDTIRFLRNTASIDGLRMDTMKHVGDTFWTDKFFVPGSPASPTQLWTVGEVFDGSVAKIDHYLDAVGSPSVFDFPLKFAIVDSLARGGSTRRLADVFAQDGQYSDPTRLSIFLDNHDVWRFASEAEQAGSAPAEADQRLDMALTLIYTARGIPVVYYGTEIAARGLGDSYDQPIGASSREDMDFTKLAASRFDERLKALADARKAYPALRRGAQRTLFAPGVSCKPPASSLNPAADFGDRLFVRGSFDSWANPPPESQLLVNHGSQQYEAAVELPAGQSLFKIAAADWTPEFSNSAQSTVPGVPTTLGSHPGTGTNSTITVPSGGCYAFALNGANVVAPVLTVTAKSAGGADPDVFAYARTMTGQKPVIVVINNQRTPVDLATLSGDGIDVQGLLANGAVTEITRAPHNLQVSNGRLVGTVPALTTLAVL